MKARACLALAVAGLALSGCGPAVNYKYHVAVIPKGLTHEFWQSIHRGADRAAEDLKAQGINVEVRFVGPNKESDALEQINLINLQTNAGVNGLVLAPQDSKRMVGPVEDADKKGIPVVIIDSGLDKEALQKNPNLIVKYVATDNYKAGRMGAEKLLEMLAKDSKPAPKLVLFRYQQNSESTDRREQGFLDYVNDKIEERKKAGEKPPELLATEYAGATVSTAQDIAGPLLDRTSDKGLDGIFAVNESAASGMLNSLVSKRLNKKFRFVGFDSSGPLLQALKEGDVDGLVIQDPYQMGYLGVWTLVQHLEGYDVSPGGDLDSGEYLLTKDNLDDPDMRGRFDPKAQAQRTIAPPKFEKKR